MSPARVVRRQLRVCSQEQSESRGASTAARHGRRRKYLPTHPFDLYDELYRLRGAAAKANIPALPSTAPSKPTVVSSSSGLPVYLERWKYRRVEPTDSELDKKRLPLTKKDDWIGVPGPDTLPLHSFASTVLNPSFVEDAKHSAPLEEQKGGLSSDSEEEDLWSAMRGDSGHDDSDDAANTPERLRHHARAHHLHHKPSHPLRGPRVATQAIGSDAVVADTFPTLLLHRFALLASAPGVSSLTLEERAEEVIRMATASDEGSNLRLVCAKWRILTRRDYLSSTLAEGDALLQREPTTARDERLAKRPGLEADDHMHRALLSAWMMDEIPRALNRITEAATNPSAFILEALSKDAKDKYHHMQYHTSERQNSWGSHHVYWCSQPEALWSFHCSDQTIQWAMEDRARLRQGTSPTPKPRVKPRAEPMESFCGIPLSSTDIAIDGQPWASKNQVTRRCISLCLVYEVLSRDALRQRSHAGENRSTRKQMYSDPWILELSLIAKRWGMELCSASEVRPK